MKKIGIITVSRTNNFGAELQAYALQKKLQLLGYEAEIIDYLYFKHRNYKSTNGSEPIHTFSLKENIKQFALYRIVTPIIESVGAVFSKSIANRIDNFERFHEDHVRFSPQYRSLRELEDAQHDYDVFMVGSDQVWNPGTATSLAPYFLMFASSDKRKVSYASSFGVSKIDQKYYSQYKAWLSNLDKIAVRENDGVKLVADIANIEATRVLDPTLLLTKNDWKEVISKPQSLPEKFLLIYQLHESESIQKWVTFVKDKFGLEVVNICKRAFFNKEIDGIRNIGDAGPAEFIELFSKASFVITNSFHGTAFSVNFNVPFITVLKEGKSNNSRMLDFLKINGLDSRIVYEGQSPSNFPEADLLCDFTNAKPRLEQEREASVEYLTNSFLST